MSRTKELCFLPFAERIERCRTLLASELPPEDAAHVGQFLAHALYNLRRPAEALQVARDYAGLGFRQAYLLELQALAMYELGMLAGVEEILLRLRELSDVPLSVQAHSILIEGWICDARGNEGALELFQRAAELFTAGGFTNQVDRCMLSAAAFCLRHGYLAQAVTFVDQVSEGSVRMQTCLRAEWLMLNGRREEALPLLNDLLSDGQAVSEATAWATYLLAEYAVHDGQVVVADTRLNRALDLLNAANYAEPVLRNKISALRASLPGVWGRYGGDQDAEGYRGAGVAGSAG